MKSVMKFASVLAIAASLTGCALVTPGNVGIRVNYYGDDKGVESTPVVTGMVWYNPFTTSILTFPTFVQTSRWEGDEMITFNSDEGMPFTAAISLSYQILPDKVPAFYVKFRTDEMEKFTGGYLHNVARDAFNEIAPRYKTEELYSTKKEELLRLVLHRINENVKSLGVEIVQLGFIGALGAPESVTNAINAKVKAIQDAQRVENELAQAKAQAQKEIATADGQAQANQKLSQSLTPQLIEWRRLQILQQAVEKWNGARPMVEGGHSGLLMNINPSDDKFSVDIPTKKQ